jgi:hypothetical protein
MQTLGIKPFSLVGQVTFGREATEDERNLIRTQLAKAKLDADKLDPVLIKVQSYDTWKDWLSACTVHLKRNMEEINATIQAVGQKHWTDPQPWGVMLYTFGSEEAAKLYLQRAKKTKEILKNAFRQSGQIVKHDTCNLLLTPTKVLSIIGQKQTLPDEDALNQE